MLIDLTRTMFFKSSFDIESQPGKDALWRLVMDLRFWLRGKAKRNGYEDQLQWDDRSWSALKMGGQMQTADGNVRLDSCLHIDGEALTWACTLSEIQNPADGRAPRRWVTELGFKGESLERGRVSIVLSYGDKPGFIGELQDEPSATIPLLIRQLLNDSTLTCSVKGAPLEMDARNLSEADAESAFSVIADPDREIPVVLLTPAADGRFPIEPAAVAAALGPNAAVAFTCDQQATSALNALLEPFDLQCRGGALRIYDAAPQLGRPGEFSRHRYIPRRDIESKGAEAIIGILRRALAQDVHFWESMLRIEDVKRLNRASSHAKRVEELRGTYEDKALEDMLEAEEAIQTAEALADEAMRENEELVQRNRELELRCTSYELAFRGSKGATAQTAETLIEYMRNLEKMPSTNREVAELAVAVFADRLDFSERGWKSIADCTAQPDVFWAALNGMATYLYPCFSGQSTEDPSTALDNNTAFSYARGEGMQTRKDPKLMAQRRDVYQGREIDIEKHVSSSNGDPSAPRFLRIYFAWDQVSGKLIVGHCGRHLDNYSTKSMH